MGFGRSRRWSLSERPFRRRPGPADPRSGAKDQPIRATRERTTTPGAKRHPMEGQTPYGQFRSLASQAALWDPPTEGPGGGVASVRGQEPTPTIPRPKGIPYERPDTLWAVSRGRTRGPVDRGPVDRGSAAGVARSGGGTHPRTPTSEGTRDPGQKRDPMTTQRPYDGFRLVEPEGHGSRAGRLPRRTDPPPTEYECLDRAGGASEHP